MRVVSLLPSVTEILGALGLSESIVGITHACDYPPEAVEGKAVVTSTEINPQAMSQEEIQRHVAGSLANGHSLYGLDAAQLEAADADVVLTQALCDVCAVSYPRVLSACARVLAGGDEEEAPRPRVISLEPTTLDEVMGTILQVGAACGAADRAGGLVLQLRADLARTAGLVSARLRLPGAARPRVAFLEWTDPLFSGGHWVPGQVEAAGGTYCGPKAGERSRALAPEELTAAGPEVIFVAPCGFDHERAAGDALQLYRHGWWRDLPAVREGRVFALDANSYFARPGPRVVQGAALLAYLLHGVESSATPDGGWICLQAPVSGSG